MVLYHHFAIICNKGKGLKSINPSPGQSVNLTRYLEKAYSECNKSPGNCKPYRAEKYNTGETRQNSKDTDNAKSK